VHTDRIGEAVGLRRKLGALDGFIATINYENFLNELLQNLLPILVAQAK
jgi:hypothetical protein